MIEKLSRKHLHVLRWLAKSDEWLSSKALPNGNGHCGGDAFASFITTHELNVAGFAEQDKRGFWRITDAGRAALAGAA